MNPRLTPTMNKIVDEIISNHEYYCIDINEINEYDIDYAFDKAAKESVLVYAGTCMNYLSNEEEVVDWSTELKKYGKISNVYQLAYAIADEEFHEDGGYDYLIERLEEIRDGSVQSTRKVHGRRISASRTARNKR